MIRALLSHHLDRVKRGQVKSAIRNCHVSGLHSVMLHDEPGNRIRLFYADASNRLWWTGEQVDRMPLAIHSHHCDVRLVGVFGNALSLSFDIDNEVGIDLTKCRFESAITGGGGKLTSRGQTRRLRKVSACPLSFGRVEELRADELHTVTVPAGQDAAWLVIEGAEDPDYVSVCYTNYPHWSADYLYGRAEQGEVATWIARALEGCP